jgi:hypothetical protein
MDDFFEDGFGEDFYEQEFEDFDGEGFEDECEDSLFYAEDYSEDDDCVQQQQGQADEHWISPLEASILAYGFGYEEGRAERRRKKQLRQDERIEEFRRRRRNERY